MPSHNQHEHSVPVTTEIPMSPKNRRLAEFTIKQFQNGVMERARSTLSSLGDVWKTKHENQHANINTKSTTINKSTALDFLSIWTRHKKTASSLNGKLNRGSKSFDNENFDKCMNFIDRHYNSDDDDADCFYGNVAINGVENGRIYSNSKCFRNGTETTSAVKHLNGVNREKSNVTKTNGTTTATAITNQQQQQNGQQYFNEKIIGDRPHKNTSTKNSNLGHTEHFDKNHNHIKQNGKSPKLKNKYIGRFSRNKSFDNDDVRPNDDDDVDDTDILNEWDLRKHSKKFNLYGRSFDETVHYLDGIACDRNNNTNNGYYRKTIINTSTDDDDSWSSGRKSNKSRYSDDNDNIQSIVKARLKFKKLTSSDDIVLNKSVKSLKPSKLFRHSSVEPQNTYVPDKSEQPNIVPIIVKKSKTDDATATKDKPDLPKKPRKKLSFREPIICGKNYCSETLPRAKRFLEEYERRKSMVRENNGLVDVDLEVYKSLWGILGSL